MGVPEHRMFLTPYSVNNDRFIAVAEIGRDRRSETRAALGIAPDLSTMPFADKFTRRKRSDDLLAAFATLQAEGVAAQLVVVRAGERLRRESCGRRRQWCQFSRRRCGGAASDLDRCRYAYGAGGSRACPDPAMGLCGVWIRAAIEPVRARRGAGPRSF